MLYEMKMREAFQLPQDELVELKYSPWGENTAPQCLFQGCFVQNRGFFFDFIAYEKDPLARFKKSGDPVYKDSCLELFCNFAPQKSDLYINFEMNANGAGLICVGNGRENRVPLKTTLLPTIRAAKTDNFWDVILYVPQEIIREVYGEKIDFSEGYEMRANVYKCGDETDHPHWLTWSPIKSEKPDFHRPEQFGVFKLVK